MVLSLSANSVLRFVVMLDSILAASSAFFSLSESVNCLTLSNDTVARFTVSARYLLIAGDSRKRLHAVVKRPRVAVKLLIFLFAASPKAFSNSTANFGRKSADMT